MQFYCFHLPKCFHPIPTILTGLDNSWRIAREEVFGPVLVAIPWEDEAEMIAQANDTHYGLAAFIFSHDISNVVRMTACSGEMGLVSATGVCCGSRRR